MEPRGVSREHDALTGRHYFFVRQCLCGVFAIADRPPVELHRTPTVIEDLEPFRFALGGARLSQPRRSNT